MGNIETYVRMVMMIVCLLACLYFTYLVGYAIGLYKKNRQKLAESDGKWLRGKCLYSMIDAVLMGCTGFMYALGFNADVLLGLLIANMVVVGLKHKQFLSKADLQRLRQSTN